MGPTTRRWLTGCGIGCGVALLLGIVGMFGGSYFFLRTFREAIATRETLEERFGDQAAFTPTYDGTIASERLEAFLRVREALMAVCPDFERTSQHFARMDEFEEDAPKGEVALEVLKLSKDLFRMVPQMGTFFDARNTALLEVGMGLGEYTYIYTMAYLDRIRAGGVTDHDSMFGDAEPNSRIHEALRQMLSHQLAALDDALDAEGDAEDDAGGDAVSDGARDLTAWREMLREEIDRLEDDPERLPWRDGLPPPLATSLAPYRSRLDEVFCAATAPLEFTKNRQKGLLGIHGN